MIHGLLELLQMLLEGLGCEGFAIVGYELLGNDTTVEADSLELIEGIQSFFGVEVGLTHYNDVTRSMVHEDAASNAEIRGLGLASGVEQSSLY